MRDNRARTDIADQTIRILRVVARRAAGHDDVAAARRFLLIIQQSATNSVDPHKGWKHLLESSL